jgi:BirA family biotin operon repressor/biotin-[acetyl-CoA-carboxylase] ligase
MMSVVLDVSGIAVERAATIPLVVGLAVAKALASLGFQERVAPWLEGRVALKWPNDVLVDGLKIAGILCERHGDNVVAGIGVNVRQREFPPEIADRATSVLLATGREMKTATVRNAILDQLGKWYGIWKERGFEAVHPEIAAIDFLKGREIEVLQTDEDPQPLCGGCGGIMPDGTLDVGGTRVYAGEAHVSNIGK